MKFNTQKFTNKGQYFTTEIYVKKIDLLCVIRKRSQNERNTVTKKNEING